ncbi:putative surface protein with fasciclin (FAS1) repeats [Hasllibacter halocynthiae]|uniref:Putative surface protein with fasciclin (FAS1) repeats n=1 Tax=Hasllibacter halocynthiae TaxID=595589 RepID=A0A2T0X3R9_9RHOB|nr:fasciclin domain-containing protein [Hasllibacter halocynthiae]PRY93580.1 putative surface protein with fasciclin (FAS1) repeats [Hasllibacter halocynthiae]
MIRTTLLAFAASTALAVPAIAQEGDIVAVATEAGDFSTLLAAAEAAGLVETLQSGGPFTVFAPTDEAFAALPEGTVDTLLMDENQDQLTKILTMHVVPGTVMSGDLSDGMTATSVEGTDLAISSTDSGFAVNGANIVTPDIETSNGVIHVIDAVILPEDMDDMDGDDMSDD